MGKEGNLLHRSVDVIARLAYLQLLWIGGCLVGGVVLGLFPATHSVYTVVKKWEEEGFYQIDHLFDFFKEEYKREFRRSNKVGWPVLLIGAFLYLDLHLATQVDHVLGMFLVAIFFVLFLLFILFLSCLFPMMSHFDGGVKELIKDTFLTSILSVGYVLLNVVVSLALIAAMVIILPTSIPFFLVSLLAIVNTKIMRRALKRIGYKKEKYQPIG